MVADDTIGPVPEIGVGVFTGMEVDVFEAVITVLEFGTRTP